MEKFHNDIFLDDQLKIQLDISTKLNLDTTKTKDFYGLLNCKTHHSRQTGPNKWRKLLSLPAANLEKIHKSVTEISKEKKLKEFHFKFLHRIIVTNKYLHQYRFGIKEDDTCLYCDEQDSIEHTGIFRSSVYTKICAYHGIMV